MKTEIRTIENNRIRLYSPSEAVQIALKEKKSIAFLSEKNWIPFKDDEIQQILPVIDEIHGVAVLNEIENIFHNTFPGRFNRYKKGELDSTDRAELVDYLRFKVFG